MSKLRLLKAKLQFRESELNLLQCEFSHNPTSFNVFKYTLNCNIIRLSIECLQNEIYQEESKLTK